MESDFLSDRCPGLTGTVEDQVPGGFSRRPAVPEGVPGGWGGVGWGGSPGTPKNPPKSAIFAKFCAEYSISALKMVKIRKKSVFDIEGFGGFSGPPWGRGRLRKPTRRPAVPIS